jgi:O-antigen/teichoic acid export membrane protein
MKDFGRIYVLNAANMASLTLAQVALVPFFLHYLGIGGYERWVFMNAAAAACIALDFGLISYTTNEIRIAYSKGDSVAVEKMVGTGVSFFLVLAAVSGLSFLLLEIFETSAEALTFLLILITAPLIMFRTWLSYVLTARTNQFGELAIFVLSTVFQTVAFVVTLALGGSLRALATVQLVVTVILGVVPALVILRRAAPELKFAPLWSRGGDLRATVTGSFHNFGYTAANLAVIQLPVILIGIIPGLPSGSLATFTASRTLTGLIRQFCQQLARSIGIEVSRFLAPEHGSQMRRMVLGGAATISLVAALGMGGILPFSDLILSFWTGKPELYSFPVLAIFCLSAVLSAQVQLPMVLPLFTNTANLMSSPLMLQVAMIAILGFAAAYWCGAVGMVAVIGLAELVTVGLVAFRRIIPSMGISQSRFLRESVLPSALLFVMAALVGLAIRKLIQPETVGGLSLSGLLWGAVVLPVALVLYKRVRG